MVIVCEYWHEKNSLRRKELDDCLKRNAALEFVDTLVLLTQPGCVAPSAEDLGKPVKVVVSDKRLTYYDTFDLVSNEFGGRICAVINADVYLLPDFYSALIETVCLKTQAACLTRWDLLPDGKLRRFDCCQSFDAYVFMAPLRLDRSLAGDYCPGILGCDAKLAYAINAAGRTPVNPSSRLVAVHNHVSNYRTYDPKNGLFAGEPKSRIHGNYLGVQLT